MILYMYIAPGQGQTTLWGHNFHVNRNYLSLCPFVASLQKKNISLKSDLLLFFFFMCYFSTCPRQSIRDKKILTTERPFLFAHMLQVSKQSFRNLILYIFFYDFIHVYSPGYRMLFTEEKYLKFCRSDTLKPIHDDGAFRFVRKHLRDKLLMST